MSLPDDHPQRWLPDDHRPVPVRRFAIREQGSGCMLGGARQGHPPAWHRAGDTSYRWFMNIQGAEQAARSMRGMGFEVEIVEVLQDGTVEVIGG